MLNDFRYVVVGDVVGSWPYLTRAVACTMLQRIRRLERERDRLHRDGITCFEGEPNINAREVARVQADIDRLRAQMPPTNLWPHLLPSHGFRR